jgi:predicted Rossmann fold flavoprotein
MNNQFDLIVIGGGAAGQMAAISAKRKFGKDFKVAILDRTFALGRKILVCGAGRCNITNINLDTDVEKRYYGATPVFIRDVLEQFSYKDIVSFFNELGVELYVERKTNIGKLFPVTDQAKTITSLLENELKLLDIQVKLNTEVTSIKKNEFFILNTNLLNQEGKVVETFTYSSKNIVMSAGGKTYPALGSNGSGYNLAENLGHSLIAPVPSALPLVSKNPLSHELQGVKMEIEVTSVIDGVEIKKRTDDVMFTQYGFSGPAILNVSREISIQINRLFKSNVELIFNFFPSKTTQEVNTLLNLRWEKRRELTIEESLYGLFPNKIASTLLRVLSIDKTILVKNLSSKQIETLIKGLTTYKVSISGTRSWNEAEFTAGGINTNEVKSNSLESKIVPNLFFCGEILDVDGDVGGFNLSWAWASGFVAGKLNK